MISPCRHAAFMSRQRFNSIRPVELYDFNSMAGLVTTFDIPRVGGWIERGEGATDVSPRHGAWKAVRPSRHPVHRSTPSIYGRPDVRD